MDFSIVYCIIRRLVVFTTSLENKFEMGGLMYKKWLPENTHKI